jgi:hypothetical protein
MSVIWRHLGGTGENEGDEMSQTEGNRVARRKGWRRRRKYWRLTKLKGRKAAVRCARQEIC